MKITLNGKTYKRSIFGGYRLINPKTGRPTGTAINDRSIKAALDKKYKAIQNVESNVSAAQKTYRERVKKSNQALKKDILGTGERTPVAKPDGADPKGLFKPKKKKPQTSGPATRQSNKPKKKTGKTPSRTEMDTVVKGMKPAKKAAKKANPGGVNKGKDAPKKAAPKRTPMGTVAKAPKKSGLPSDVLRKFQGTYNQKTEALRNIVVNGKKSTYVVKKKKK